MLVDLNVGLSQRDGTAVDPLALVQAAQSAGLDGLVTFPFGVPHVHFNTWLDGVPVDLTGADLSNADLQGVDLTDADLRGANLTNAKLNDATLTRADLRDAILTGVNWDRAEVDGVLLSDGENIGD